MGNPLREIRAADGLTKSNAEVGERVSQFYNDNPFPGFDIFKYIIRDDLYRNANLYSRMLDDQIPWEASVLDAGCGTGQLACLLGVKGRRVLGIDFSEKSLNKAEELRIKLDIRSVTFMQADLLNLPTPEETFDYIFCNGVLHHTGNPYLGFRNILKYAHPGTYLVIGLYNTCGRTRLRWKRRWVNWRYKNNLEKARGAILEMLAKDERDQEKQDTWYQDQYLHPHELSHSIGELLGWYRRNDIAYINSLPTIELFRKEKAAYRIFNPSAVKGWRNSLPAHFLKQAKWMVSLRKTGGYFMIVGRVAGG